jgi:broad specificity phosphatase PhoE
MKTLRYMRHSLKRGSFISNEGLAYAYSMAITNIPANSFTDLFYGPFFRTIQTLLAIATALGLRATVHEVIPEIGSEADGKRIQTPELLKAVENGMSEWDAFHTVLPAEEQESLVSSFADGIRKMFTLMPEDGHGLAVGHDLIIPLAVNRITGFKIENLKECQFVDLVMDNDGRVTVKSVSSV